MTPRRPQQASPTFLIIGAARAGTNWLWMSLSNHPEVWMPPAKELHYFDRSPSYPSPSYLAPPTVIGRMLARGRAGAAFRRSLVRRVVTDLSQRRWDLLRWDLTYHLGRCDDSWYKSLFAPAKERVSGEATPAYAILDAPDVERIVTLIPDVRVVFVLRNPIERAWSHLRHQQGSAIRTGEMSIDAMYDFVEGPAQTLRSDYSRTIDIWSRYVPDERFHVAFYDQLVADPNRFFKRVCGFLGVDGPGADVSGHRARVFNAAPASPMPEPLRRHLASKYRAPITRLAEVYGDPPSRWLRDAGRICREG